MNSAHFKSVTTVLALLAMLMVPPVHADRDNDRGGGRLLRSAPEQGDQRRGFDSDHRRQPDREIRPEPRRPVPASERAPSGRDTRTPPPSTPTPARRELRKDVPRGATTPAPQTPRAREPVRHRQEPERKPRTQPAPVQREPRRIPPVVTPPPLPKPPPGYILDKRHSHNHYYPPRGHLVPSLPAGHRRIVFRGVHYHYHAGVWYRPSGTRYIVVSPPYGLTITFLPPFFTIIWVGAVPYYYAAGVYYLWYPEYHYYRVVEPPPESDIREQPPGSEELYVYPKEGQSAEQQAQDRYECHRWAVEQTGFDPTLPGGNVWRSEYDSKRADYRRAMKACLEARGYSVQ